MSSADADQARLGLWDAYEQHNMDGLIGQHIGLDGIDEANDRTVRDIESHELGDGAVPLVIVGHGRATTTCPRQAGLHAS